MKFTVNKLLNFGPCTLLRQGVEKGFRDPRERLHLKANFADRPDRGVAFACNGRIGIFAPVEMEHDQPDDFDPIDGGKLPFGVHNYNRTLWSSIGEKVSEILKLPSDDTHFYKHGWEVLERLPSTRDEGVCFSLNVADLLGLLTALGVRDGYPDDVEVKICVPVNQEPDAPPVYSGENIAMSGPVQGAVGFISAKGARTCDFSGPLEV